MCDASQRALSSQKSRWIGSVNPVSCEEAALLGVIGATTGNQEAGAGIRFIKFASNRPFPPSLYRDTTRTCQCTADFPPPFHIFSAFLSCCGNRLFACGPIASCVGAGPNGNNPVATGFLCSREPCRCARRTPALSLRGRARAHSAGRGFRGIAPRIVAFGNDSAADAGGRSSR